MMDIRRKNLSKSVWIPLRAFEYKIKSGKYGYEGFKEDLFASGSIAVPCNQIDDAKKIDWEQIGSGHQHSGWVNDGQYIPAEVFSGHDDNVQGIHLVLEQYSQDESPNIWHLNQDIVLSLGIVREKNSWIRPADGYMEVARLRTDDTNEPISLEIKIQYLKDYLCARGMALYMTHYYKRNVICNDASNISWSDNFSSESTEEDRWEGRVNEIHEGGFPFGEKIAVYHIERTDIDEQDDVPDISAIPTDENTHGKSWENAMEGEKLYFIEGELWRKEIILPGKTSPIVRGDMVKQTTSFAIDADGSKVCGDDLINSGKWLWFKPEVIMALCHRRGGDLSFCTAQTGRVSCNYGHSVHFGINELSLINVYAKDIGLLPDWQQQIWAAYNITPEGGVSSELLASQVRAQPANTIAPEEFLLKSIERINFLAQKKLAIKIFRDHEAIPELVTRIHRFRSIDEQSFYALAKDLARLIVDSLDAQAMQTIVSPPKKEKWGTLKYLENLLASQYNRKLIRRVTASLVGIYELRHADAHLPSSTIEDAFNLIDIDKSKPYVHQGFQMLYKVVSSLTNIAKLLESF
ncbi:TPA: hypothetical protein ACQ53F_001072 [Legionella pneumophila]